MKPSNYITRVIWLIVFLIGGYFFFVQNASAEDETIFPIDGPGTINLGNQGLFISTPPVNVAFVEIIKILPPLPVQYTSGFDIIFHGPALDIAFMNADMDVVEPWATPTSVYFNLEVLESKMWEDSGLDDFGIWFYNKKTRIWSICPTRYLPEKQNNGKLDRLACFFMGNGVYVLGYKEIGEYFVVEGPSTVNLGKQGLFISNPPPNIAFVKIEKIEPPLPYQYTLGIDIAYRGPALEITFLNSNKAVVKPGATLTSVYFNISEPEVRFWEEGGSEEIAIWYYNESSKEWRLCQTRYIAERQDNEKYDRLACIIMGNGVYLLGKMAFDPILPLWFKLQGEELEVHNKRLQHY